jgi:hypothetical protein
MAELTAAERAKNTYAEIWKNKGFRTEKEIVSHFAAALAAARDAALVEAEQAITDYKWTGLGNSYLAELVKAIRALRSGAATKNG